MGQKGWKQVTIPTSDHEMTGLTTGFPSNNRYIFWTSLDHFWGHCFNFEGTFRILYTTYSNYKMSNRAERVAEDNYERKNDPSPVTGTFRDDSYAKETNPNLRGQVPIQGDNQQFDDPMQPPYSNTDQQLGKLIFC
jgi:hypothetical protein